MTICTTAGALAAESVSLVDVYEETRDDYLHYSRSFTVPSILEDVLVIYYLDKKNLNVGFNSNIAQKCMLNCFDRSIYIKI